MAAFLNRRRNGEGRGVVTGGEIMGGALTAAIAKGFFPDTVANAAEVVEGEMAVSVLFANQFGGWIVCVHENKETPRDGWYVTGNLPEGDARTAAAAYASKGLL